MTPALTAEQIGELEALLEDTMRYPAYDGQSSWMAVRDAAPALIAMARHSLEMDEAAFADQGALTTAIGRAETAESRVKELEQACRHSSDWATCAIEDMKKAETEVATLRARLQSTESAMGRAMELGSEWRKEAAELRAQMMGDQGRHIAETEAETPRTCETCLHLLKNLGEDQCLGCGGQQSAFSRWTPKPIPSTTDKGEKP